MEKIIQASIKKSGKGDKINKKDLNRMLFDIKQQIKGSLVRRITVKSFEVSPRTSAFRNTDIEVFKH